MPSRHDPRKPRENHRLGAIPEPDAALGPDPKAARDAILLESLAAALGEVRQLLGPDTANWAWGKLHHAQFEHALSPLADGPTRTQTSVGRLALGGSAFSPRAASYRPSDFRVIAGASFRMVLDAGDWDGSVVNAPGQSGDPFSPHYRDLRRGVPHDPVADFTPRARLATAPLVRGAIPASRRRAEWRLRSPP